MRCHRFGKLLLFVAFAMVDARADDVAAPPATEPRGAISGNPGAVDITPGTGWLGRTLGLDAIPGLRLGGVAIGSGNYLTTGGVDPGTKAFAGLLLVDLHVDAEKLAGIPGGSFGAEFLQFGGEPANARAGSVTGYNSLVAAPPLDRSQLYEIWWRQALFDDKLILRIGKTIPTYDFVNVTSPVPTADPTLEIPAVTGLGYAPAFVLPTMLGFIPGYYDSAYGVTATFAPVEELYVKYGGFDGNLARGEKTGLEFLPEFNGYYFHVGELGGAWLLGEERKPGGLAAGVWAQTGHLSAGGEEEDGAHGFYVFGSQRLWFQRPGVDASGVTGFFQVGVNDAETPLANVFAGVGLTAFGLVPGRPMDSFGAGFAWSNLNRDLGFRTNEAMVAAYYQLHVAGAVFFQPIVTYIPTPGATSGLDGALALSANLTVLF